MTTAVVNTPPAKNGIVKNAVVKNLANIVSILGVLPICVLFGEDGFQYLLPLIIYNNVMDDLDGVLAGKLNIRSNFGALMDNVCDSIPHTVFVMTVGMHFFQGHGLQGTGNQYLGGLCLATGLAAAAAMIVRGVTRIDPASATGTGSPTNELIRHMFFVLLLAGIFGFDPTPYLIVVFILHAVSMVAPFKMPYLIRSLTKSATAIGMVNVALFAAWMWPTIAPIIAASFFVTYLASYATGGTRWLRSVNA